MRQASKDKLSQAGRRSLQNWSSIPPSAPTISPPIGIPSSQLSQPALLSFTANHQLYQQLTKQPTFPSTANVHHPVNKQTTKQLLQSAREFKLYEKSHMVSEEDKLMAEIKNLNDFKPVSTSTKTKEMVEGIVLKKREQHLGVYEQFKDEVERSLNSIGEVQKEIRQEGERYFKLDHQQIDKYLQQLNDSNLLKKGRQILNQLTIFISNTHSSRQQKLQDISTSLSSLFTNLNQQYNTRISTLRQNFRDIAFLSSQQCDKICLYETQNLTKIINESTQRIRQFNREFRDRKEEDFEEKRKELEEKKERWGRVNREEQIRGFVERMKDPMFAETEGRVELFKGLRGVQEKVHREREGLVKELVQKIGQVEIITKLAVDKWLQEVRGRSQQANRQIDILFSKLLQDVKSTKQLGQSSLSSLKQKLTQYNCDPDQLSSIISTQCAPLMLQTEESSKKLLSDSIAYIEKYESLEGEVCEKLGGWFGQLASVMDKHKKRMEQENQGYEIEKAKILDDDEQRLEELMTELEVVKKELKQALHHIKLEEVEKKCWEKVEQIQKHYRDVYEKEKELVAGSEGKVTKAFEDLEQQVVSIFGLVSLSKKDQLLTKLKQALQLKILKQIEKQDLLKAQQLQRVREQESKKKGGKVPPKQKPKDPKKQAQELEQRKQAMMKEVGVPVVREVTINGKQWVVEKEISDICDGFYEGNVSVGNAEDDSPNLPVDFVQPPILSPLGTPLLSSSILLPHPLLISLLSPLQPLTFTSLSSLLTSSLTILSLQNKSYLTVSLSTLDTRLKTHYPLRSTIQNQLINKRSNQITSHKKRYEKHARTTKEKVDQGTERFNLGLERGMEVMKKWGEERKGLREELGKVGSVAGFQGVGRRGRESNERMEQTWRQISNQLTRLAGQQLQSLILKNNDFLTQLSSLPSTQYSPQQLTWYTTMMSQISIQLNTQQTKRSQKLVQLTTHFQKKKQELLQVFDKEYEQCVDNVAAKDGAGGKYGKPRVVGQERMRVEMNKCERAQQGIEKEIERLEEMLRKEGRGNEGQELLLIRQQLMTIRTCIGRYFRHLQAQSSTLPQPSRPNYTLLKPTSLLPQSQKPNDSTRKLQQLSSLNQLSQQPQTKVFSSNILDIIKVIKDEIGKIYVGQKAKLLNGDKVTESTGEYIVGVRKQAEGFRIGCVRGLREACRRVTGMAEKVNEKVFELIQSQAERKQEGISSEQNQEIDQLLRQNDATRSLHMKKLSPNLANPASRNELVTLDTEETQKRAPVFVQQLAAIKTKMLDGLFTNSSEFLNSLLNNFQFLVNYYDTMVLDEDIMVLPGDVQGGEGTKKHMNLRQLMLMKEKGGVSKNNERATERGIIKKWSGVKYDVFDQLSQPRNKFVYQKPQSEQPNTKDSKKPAPAKKEAKKQVQVPVQEVKVTKDIQSVKTKKQKGVFMRRNEVYEVFVKRYRRECEGFEGKVGKAEEEEGVFREKWRETVERLKKAGE